MIDRDVNLSGSEKSTYWHEFAEQLLTRPDEEMQLYAVRARAVLFSHQGRLTARNVPDIVSLTASDFDDAELQDAKERLREGGTIDDELGIQMYQACWAVSDLLGLHFSPALLEESSRLTFSGRNLEKDGFAFYLTLHGARLQSGERLTVIPENVA